MKKIVILYLLQILCLSATFAQRKSFFFTTSDSVQLYVEVVGKGEPLVFVHGGPGSTAYYLQATGAAPLLEQQVQMIYYDQRGSGRSKSSVINDYSLRRMLLDLEELRQFLGLKQWIVMGHSFAGTIVTQYAKDFPMSTKKLILAHCTLNMQLSILSHIRFGVQALKLADSAALLNGPMPIMERLRMVHDTLFKAGQWYKLMYRNQYEKDINDGFEKQLVSKNWDFANQVWNIQDYFADFMPITADIKCPVLIISGKKDYAIGPDHYLGFRFPKSKLVYYQGGHASFQEEPQWFTEKVINFVK